METLRPKESAFSSLKEVRKFVTRVWEHPLLDEQTAQHRHLAKSKIEGFMAGIGIFSDQFVAIPIGSVVWATDEKSDFDYIVIFRDARGYADFSIKLCLVEDLEATGINILKALDWFEVVGSKKNEAVNLFLTPDEYLGGDVFLARNLRMAIMESLEKDKNAQQDWESVLRSIFFLFYRDWDSPKLCNPRFFRTRKHEPDRERHERVARRIEVRSRQTYNPELWKAAFVKARNNISVPKFATFYQAMQMGWGALSLLPQYKADGIRQEEATELHF